MSGRVRLALVATVIFAISPARGARKDLLRGATFVADAKNWWGTRFRCDIGIQWLSGAELVHARYTGDYDPERLATRINLRRSAYLLDLRTRHDTLLPSLTGALNSVNPEIVDSMAVSPDGRWFAWSERWGCCLVAQVKGRRRYLYPEDDDGCYRRVLWMADSRRWLEMFHVNGRVHHLILHDVTRPVLARMLPLRDQRGLLANISQVTDLSHAIALTKQDLGPDDMRPRARTVQVWRVAPDGRRPAARIASMRAPGASRVNRAEVSPRGDRIAWEFVTRRPDQSWLCDLWVSRIDGSRLRRIGSVIARGESDDDSAPTLNAGWLPDGRRASFVWKDRLYTVAAGV